MIRDSLKPHEASLIPKLWSTLDSAKPGDVSLLRAASALADYDGTSPRWEAVGGKVAEALGACPGISIQVTSTDDQSVQVASIRPQCLFAPIPAA